MFDTRELRRLSLRDALLEQGLAPTIDHDVDRRIAAARRGRRSLALQALEHDDVLLDLVALRAERAFSTSTRDARRGALRRCARVRRGRGGARRGSRS